MDIGDLYAGLNALDAVRLFEFDIHYRKNKLGSAVELPI